MLFHSPEFIFLMLITCALYAAFPRIRLALLAVGNLLFYGTAGLPHLLLFLAAASMTHLCAAGAAKPHGRLLLWIGILANLGNLLLFKYTGFVSANLASLLHIALPSQLTHLLLPVGISFYTFQLMAYLIDVYRGDLVPANSLLEFWVFIAFFGQLVAGPIERGAVFLPQIQRMRSIRVPIEKFKHGIFVFVLGLVKKIVVADVIATYTDKLFGQAHQLGGLDAWVAGWLFAFQIYYDFSAYSDMAVGVGHMFGFDLTVNFRTPYLAHNPAEFWQRWHISLSSFIRDYIYIPLGGSRRGKFRSYVNLLVAMTLSGLWHGAAWTFVAWGMFHGGLSVIHRWWKQHVAAPLRWKGEAKVIRWVSVFVTFQAVTIGWILFRSDGIRMALHLIHQMLTPWQWGTTQFAAAYLPVLGLLALCHVIEFWFLEKKVSLYEAWLRWVPTPVRATAYMAVVILLVLTVETSPATFIYFRF